MPSQPVLVLGTAGRLGAALARELAREREVLAWGRAEADLSDPEAAAARVRHSGAAVVVNCAALTNVDVCEAEPELARRVNAEAPARIAETAADMGARCLQFSTDYVFSGRHPGLRAEDDQPAPLSCYGATKLEGELGVLGAADRHIVVRVAWVFGPDRGCFLDKALGMALKGEPVRAVADKFSSPTYTLDAAKALDVLLEPGSPGGVYHLCNHGYCSWQQWAQEGIDAAVDLGLEVPTRHVAPIRLADLALMSAPRPVHTGMSCARLEALRGTPMRPWQEAVRDYVRLLRESGRLRGA